MRGVGCYIFNSSDADDGFIKLKKIVKFYYDRKSFINIYRRKNISKNLVKEILKLWNEFIHIWNLFFIF